MGTMLGIGDFQANVRWFNRWYGIEIKSICDEARDVPTKTINQWRAGEVATFKRHATLMMFLMLMMLEYFMNLNTQKH